MNNFYQACKIAYEYYKEAWHIEGLAEAKDLGEKWLFYPKGKENFVGNSHITIAKNDAKMEYFILPDKDNFARLREATIVEIPEEYK